MRTLTMPCGTEIKVDAIQGFTKRDEIVEIFFTCGKSIILCNEDNRAYQQLESLCL